MKNINQAGPSKAKREFLRAGTVWLVAAAILMAILVPCFSLIWRDRTQTHTKEECGLLADAVLKQSVVSEKGVLKSIQFLRTYLLSLNALSGWAYAYGGTADEELSTIYETCDYLPEGVAVLRDGEYQVLRGDFPKKEFDAALKQVEKKIAEQSAAAAEDYESVLSAGKEADGTASFLIKDGETLYLSAVLPLSGTTVISKMASVPELEDDPNLQLAFMTIAGSVLEDSGIGIAMIRLSDHQAVLADGIPELREGDILDEEPDENGNLKIGGTRYIGGLSEDSSYRVYAVVPASEIFSKTVVSPIFLALIFALVFLLTELYAWFLRTDYLRGRVEEENPAERNENVSVVLLRHVRLVFYIISVCAAILIVMNCALHVVDSTRVWGSRILSDVEGYFDADDQSADLITNYRKEFKLSVLDITRSLVEASPERMTDEALSDLSGAVERDLYVLDPDGKVVAASRPEYDFSEMTDPESNLYALISVLNGKADHKAIAVSEDETSSLLCWAARLRKTGGMLVSIDHITQSIAFADYYADYQVPEGLVLFVVDLETNEILSSSDGAYIGKSAESIGLTEEVLRDGFAGDIILNGKSYFVQTNQRGERSDLIAADLGYLARVYFPIIAMTVIVGILTVFLMFALVWRIQKKLWDDLAELVEARRAGLRTSNEDLPANTRRGRRILPTESPEDETREEENAEFYREEGGKLYTDRSAAGRWLNLSTPFRRQSADEKFRTVIYLLFLVMLALAYLAHQHLNSYELMDSAFSYLLQRSWRRGFNIYAISYALLVFCMILAVGLILRRVILFLGRRLGSRGETIARLVSSFIAYASVIFAFAYCLVFVGVNTTAILASAGIIGLAISIGAKDLIADILAGISIVFEGEFRTGDIVEIGGYRGTVEEIGVRTTKVMSMENVKVFRNSNISGVVNMTQRYSIAQVSIDVSRNEPLEKIEAIFCNALPEIRSKIPQAVSDIVLCGMEQVNAKSVVLLFQTKCRESDRIQVERQLRRELDLLMEREKIAAV